MHRFHLFDTSFFQLRPGVAVGEDKPFFFLRLLREGKRERKKEKHIHRYRKKVGKNEVCHFSFVVTDVGGNSKSLSISGVVVVSPLHAGGLHSTVVY